MSVYLSSPCLLFIFLIYQMGGFASPGADRLLCHRVVVGSGHSAACGPARPDGWMLPPLSWVCLCLRGPSNLSWRPVSVLYLVLYHMPKHPPTTIHAAPERVKPCTHSVTFVCPALSICPVGAEGISASASSSFPIVSETMVPASGFLTHFLLDEGVQGAEVSTSRCCVPVSWDGTLPGHGILGPVH